MDNNKIALKRNHSRSNNDISNLKHNFNSNLLKKDIKIVLKRLSETIEFEKESRHNLFL